MLRRTEDEGDGDLLSVSVTVDGEFLKQPLLIIREDQPGWRTQTCQLKANQKLSELCVMQFLVPHFYFQQVIIIIIIFNDVSLTWLQPLVPEVLLK